MKFKELFDNQAWLHLLSIADQGDNRLCVKVSFAITNPSKTFSAEPLLGRVASFLIPIEPSKDQCFELTWPRYLLFLTRDETQSSSPGPEVYEGHGIRNFSKSWLLESYPRLIHSPEILPAKVIHQGIYCLNHIVDVLAYEEPAVRKL
jgi:hypothetical protein